MVRRKKDQRKITFKIAFAMGRHEHFLESLTNALLFPTIILAWINYFNIISIKNSDEMVLMLLTLSFTIHMIARYCHRRERKFHRKARKMEKK